MRQIAAFAIASALLVITAKAQTISEPQPVDLATSSSVNPYRYNGMIRAGEYIGSGSLAGPRLVLTAAHVIFEDSNYTWITDVRFALRHNAGRNTNPSGIAMAGSHRLSSYSQAVKDKTAEQYEFNSDIAALYSLADMDSIFHTVFVKAADEPSALTDHVEKLVVGYPVNDEEIDARDQGRMHGTGPADWNFYDSYTDYLDPNPDPYGVPFATMEASYVKAVGGNSGGPLYVRDADDGDSWVMVGVLVAGTSYSPYLSIYRLVDSSAVGLMKLATDAGAASVRFYLPSGTATANAAAVQLNWEDNAIGETKWEIRRRDGDGWKVVGSIDPGSTSFVDTTASAGTRYNYRVRAVGSGGNGPWSNLIPASATTEGSRKDIGSLLGAPQFKFTSGGDSPFFIDNTGVRSGTIQSMSESWLQMQVSGPGTLTFNWGVDCEPGEDGEIFDSLRVELDGNVRYRIDGTTTGVRSVNITDAGPHTIRWVYDKDPYESHNSDLGRLNSVSYSTTDALAALGATSNLVGDVEVPMLGWVYNIGNGWIYDWNLGYLYLSLSAGNVWMWSGDARFGWMWASASYWPIAYSNTAGWLYNMGDGWFYAYDAARAGAAYLEIRGD